LSFQTFLFGGLENSLKSCVLGCFLYNDSCCWFNAVRTTMTLDPIVIIYMPSDACFDICVVYIFMVYFQRNSFIDQAKLPLIASLSRWSFNLSIHSVRTWPPIKDFSLLSMPLFFWFLLTSWITTYQQLY